MFQDILADLMPHKHCFAWAQSYVPIYVMANAATAIAYLIISVLLFYVFFKRTDLRFNFHTLVYALFIFCCGVGHFVMVINMYKGFYILETYVHLITSFVSLGAAYFTLRAVPIILAIKNIKSIKRLDLALSRLERFEGKINSGTHNER